MKISIKKIETAEISDISSPTSIKVIGGKSQFGSIDISAFAGNSSAGASLYFVNSGENPVSEFGAGVTVRETPGESYAGSYTFASLR